MKKIYMFLLMTIALAFLPTVFALPEPVKTDSTLAVTFWPINSGRQNTYCLVARLAWFTWNGEMRPIVNAEIQFFLNGLFIQATTNARGFAYITVRLTDNTVFYAEFRGNNQYEPSFSHECLVRMAHQHGGWWP